MGHGSGTPMTIEEQMRQMNERAANIEEMLAQRGTATTNPYLAARSEFVRDVRITPGFAGVNPELLKTGRVSVTTDPYVRSDTGKLLYGNGVIFDPGTGSVLMPPGEAVPGSYEWTLEIQDSWDDKKANEWRKKLWAQGYQGGDFLQSETGGMANDLLSALVAYHQNRYANGGKVLPLQPKEGVAGRGQQIREAVDPVALREEVKTWGKVPFGEDLNEAASEYLAERTIELAARLAKKHETWSPEQAFEGAKIRAQKEFTKMPGIKGALREAEEDEMDESLREHIISLAQLGGI